MDEPLLSLGGGIWCNLSEKQGQNLTDEQEALFSLLLGNRLENMPVRCTGKKCLDCKQVGTF
jgi:hypothetical protein